MIHAPSAPLILRATDRIFRAPSFAGLASNPWTRLAPAAVILAPLDWLAEMSGVLDPLETTGCRLDFAVIECRATDAGGTPEIRMTSPARRAGIDRLLGMGFTHIAAVALLVSIDSRCTTLGQLHMMQEWAGASSAAGLRMSLPCPMPAADLRQACGAAHPPIFSVARIRILESNGEHLLFRSP